jgi:hypothetical protein
MAIRYFVFAEAVLEMVFLFDQFLDLVSKGNIGQKEAAVLLVVVIFGRVPLKACILFSNLRPISN